MCTYVSYYLYSISVEFKIFFSTNIIQLFVRHLVKIKGYVYHRVSVVADMDGMEADVRLVSFVQCNDNRSWC